jgi:glyoxylase-like metal-dependent hydrolase (beta-lactamase superfamily II)
LKIEFDVTPQIKRFVYIYIIAGRRLYLIDAGVDGAEKAVGSYLESIGRRMEEIDAILLTHSHPDHIGAADKICNATGCRVYACAGEREWIENIDKQFADRPIPNFYRLVNHSVRITDIIRDRDILRLEKDITIRVINACGHSPESLAYNFSEERALFTGDAIPATGDIPIYISAEKSLGTLDRLSSVTDIDLYLPAWDEPADAETGLLAIRNASALLQNIDETARKTANEFPDLKGEELFRMICAKLGMDQAAAHPLFRTSVFSGIRDTYSDRWCGDGK